MQFDHCVARLVQVETVQGQLWDQLRIRARLSYEGMPSADRFPPDEQVPRAQPVQDVRQQQLHFAVTRSVERPRGGGADLCRGRGRRRGIASGATVNELGVGFKKVRALQLLELAAGSSSDWRIVSGS